MRRSYTFLIRVLLDDNEPAALHGQITEPVGNDEWRVTFASAAELWRALADRTQAEANAALAQDPIDRETI